jgi:hypothetical protein
VGRDFSRVGFIVGIDKKYSRWGKLEILKNVDPKYIWTKFFANPRSAYGTYYSMIQMYGQKIYNQCG